MTPAHLSSAPIKHEDIRSGFGDSGRTLERGALCALFDSVVMLTWSDWKTEPRSNRYHYATRFAKGLPVFFVQADGAGGAVAFEPSGYDGVTLVHASESSDDRTVDQIRAALRDAGARRPLLWIYNVHFEALARKLRAPMKIFHATEDYVSPVESLKITPSDIGDQVRRVLASVDLLVAVSDGVARAYREYGAFGGETLVLKNGCDFEFWNMKMAERRGPSDAGEKIALFQGGINQRLDYDLLIALAGKLPDWRFWFCGKSDDAPAKWRELQALPNVTYHGQLSPDDIAGLAAKASVGLIPFVNDGVIRRSLPLKAYEYAACGLPAVTTPIDELAARPDLFAVAETADDFALALERLAPTRRAEEYLKTRTAAARAESYDSRFEALEKALSSLSQRFAQSGRGEILVLYDDRSTHVRAIAEHLDAFRKYSRHGIVFFPATGALPGGPGSAPPIDFDLFDAVFIHFSVRLSVEDHLSPALVRSIAEFEGLKALFIQDEYDTPEIARKWIERLGVNALYSNVPHQFIDAVYPRTRFPALEVLPTLTGYVPEDPQLDAFGLPLAERRILIGYRGRRLPHQYGLLGQEKFRIGVDVKRMALARGLAVDIESDDDKRIYGADWYRFVGSCRAVLGTESGCNVFDDDGRLAALAKRNTDMPFEEFAERFLEGQDGRIRMNQVSPKIFEAIRLGAALILFEGDYSGIIKPYTHYIPLKKDYSNIKEVFDLVQDLEFVRAMTECAHKDVVESGRYSYRAFVAGVDDFVSKALCGPARPRTRFLRGPTVAMSGRASILSAQAAGRLLTDSPLGGGDRELVLSAGHEEKIDKTRGTRGLRILGSVKQRLRAHLAALSAESANQQGGTAARRALRMVWRLLPLSARRRLMRRLEF